MALQEAVLEPDVRDFDIQPHRPRRGTVSENDSMNRALGWFSIGLGLTQLVAPRELARFIGVPDQPFLLRFLGMREISSGLGILTKKEPSNWLWSRVAGDLMDLALLGIALKSDESDRKKVLMAAAGVAGVTALDWMASQKSSQASGRILGLKTRDGMIVGRTAMTINKDRDELYRFWRDLENLPRFMNQIESVHRSGERESHWVARGPAGVRLEWDAETVDDRPGERISWRSLPGSRVESRGTVEFEEAPSGQGTEVRLRMEYRPPAGVAGALAAKLIGQEPEQQMREDLRRFKRLMETGEIPTTEGQPSARSMMRRDRKYER